TPRRRRTRAAPHPAACRPCSCSPTGVREEKRRERKRGGEGRGKKRLTRGAHVGPMLSQLSHQTKPELKPPEICTGFIS
ncbi:Os09g0432700, partial [Oryza sativa Japonica Group]